jgi:hypothetical protein
VTKTLDPDRFSAKNAGSASNEYGSETLAAFNNENLSHYVANLSHYVTAIESVKVLLFLSVLRIRNFIFDPVFLSFPGLITATSVVIRFGIRCFFDP